MHSEVIVNLKQQIAALEEKNCQLVAQNQKLVDQNYVLINEVLNLTKASSFNHGVKVQPANPPVQPQEVKVQDVKVQPANPLVQPQEVKVQPANPLVQPQEVKVQPANPLVQPQNPSRIVGDYDSFLYYMKRQVPDNYVILPSLDLTDDDRKLVPNGIPQYKHDRDALLGSIRLDNVRLFSRMANKMSIFTKIRRGKNMINLIWDNRAFKIAQLFGIKLVYDS
jgi:hypothetical protein